jgi:hypothetical protein
MRTISRGRRGSLIVLMCISGLAVFNATALMAQSGFTELVPSGPTAPPVVPGASPWGAGVQLAAAFLGWLSDQGLRTSINAKLEELKPQIDAAMPPTGGVLVVVGIQQSEQPDSNGNFVRSVLDGYIGGAGATPKATMDAYLAQDRLETGVPDGFVRRNVYFWRTASSPNSATNKAK